MPTDGLALDAFGITGGHNGARLMISAAAYLSSTASFSTAFSKSCWEGWV